MEPQRLRRHGCAGPPNCYQVVSWLLILALCSLFFSLLLPNCPRELFQCGSAGFSSCLFVAVVSYLKCSLADPSDAGVLYRLNPTVATPSNAFTRFCARCQANVQSTSKHCRTCNRCTANFDHHCKWVNNCIGGKNYRWFVALIIGLEGLLLVEMGTAGFLLFEVFKDGVESSEIAKRYDFGELGLCFVFAVSGTAFLCLFLSVMDGFLIAFHVVLRIRRISTFEYLLKRGSTKVHANVYAVSKLRDPAIEERSSALQERSEVQPLQLVSSSKCESSSNASH